eukprot:TRINITY_DN52319_c0_g1_i1.p3 TRINITY_DN52319_c0_g1~~TRINITY_DN52319_c0_g1_i1.p3  ORF type:complete len:154 (+),score=14.48 TRINITY_DN52319_c0_g1_i1:267-728(+)
MGNATELWLRVEVLAPNNTWGSFPQGFSLSTTLGDFEPHSPESFGWSGIPKVDHTTVPVFCTREWAVGTHKFSGEAVMHGGIVDLNVTELLPVWNNEYLGHTFAVSLGLPVSGGCGEFGCYSYASYSSNFHFHTWGNGKCKGCIHKKCYQYTP